MIHFSWARFTALPVVGILRGFSAEETAGILGAARLGGLTTVEITMDTPEAERCIAESVAAHGDHFNLGAGTVTSPATLHAALRAGARFVVTPTFNPTIVARCRALGVPVFPGALSPTEIVAAREAGADLVKVFPADGRGPEFIRQLKMELPGVRLLPTGGVDLGTLAAYRAAGADGFGVGSPLFHRDRIRAGDWDWVTAQCRAFVAAFPPLTRSLGPRP